MIVLPPCILLPSYPLILLPRILAFLKTFLHTHPTFPPHIPFNYPISTHQPSYHPLTLTSISTHQPYLNTSTLLPHQLYLNISTLLSPAYLQELCLCVVCCIDSIQVLLKLVGDWIKVTNCNTSFPSTYIPLSITKYKHLHDVYPINTQPIHITLPHSSFHIFTSQWFSIHIGGYTVLQTYDELPTRMNMETVFMEDSKIRDKDLSFFDRIKKAIPKAPGQ